MIQPIETYYAGCRFRSRLEARWAVFFDCLGIAWEYEPEGYALDEDTWYLPDFLLPKLGGGIWCEVKPPGGDFTHAKRFAESLNITMWLCEGTPDFQPYTMLFPMFGANGYSERHVDHECHIFNGGSYVAPEWIFYSQPGTPINLDTLDRRVVHAIEQSRGARFEREDKGIRYKPPPMMREKRPLEYEMFGEFCVCCPGCGEFYLHHDRVEVFDRAEDAKEGLHVVIEELNYDVDSSMTGCPSVRRHGLVVYFWCEHCEIKPALHIAQRKGNTQIYWSFQEVRFA